ncbi:MAG TPA: fibronectin/fibrinogen-binding protein [Clostridiales bacterium]|nr:fibronectin/fibrinogen-binding protein [Clostridiales bacterium]
MAFDGVVIANVIKELRDTFYGGRISKIAQPEKDELILTVKGASRSQHKLLISAGAGLPLIYLTENTKPSPMTAPNFCMLLRKHLNSAKILDIYQPGLERIINFKLEHLDEMGDLRVKYLIVELMGKHSNIIFCDENMKIIDSIKRVNQFISSVREVLPGRDYFIPATSEKYDPLSITYELFRDTILQKPMPVGKALYNGLTGISPLLANEICHRASIDAQEPTGALGEAAGLHLYKNLERFMEKVKAGSFSPNIVSKDGIPVEFSSVILTSYSGYDIQEYASISALLEAFYSTKNAVARIRQKSFDLRKIVSNAIDRTTKKYDLQLKQLQDTEKRDKFKVYGELLTAYGYGLEPGAKVLNTVNYYNNEEISIPLDPTMTPMENAKHYFEKYNKLKRTFDALSKQIQETREEMEHLDSIKTALDIATEEDDLTALKQELTEYGYIRRRFTSGSKKLEKKASMKKSGAKSKPFHYVSSDGFHMYVGKNNYQNDELTFHFADGGDLWFHAKKIAGSHVIVKAEGKELPDRTYEEAARLAAYYSSARDADKVEIDYTLKKNVKKPAGGKPGFVVYYTNYSMVSSSDITGIAQL